MGDLIKNMLARDAVDIIADIGEVATWNGTNYNVILGDPDVSSDLEEGGFVLDGDFVLKFLRADFASGAGPFPENNDRITYDGDVYKITSSTQRVDSAFIKTVIAK